MTNQREALVQADGFDDVLDGDGHLTDLAVTCIADGAAEAMGWAADGPAHLHLESCDHCARRVGESALFSMAASDALRSAAQPAAVVVPDARPVVVPGASLAGVTANPPSSRRARRPLPVLAIAAALAVAAITAGPSFMDAASGLHATIADLLGTAPFLARVALSILRAPWGQGRSVLVLQIASAVVLMAVGLRVARLTSRSRSLQQGGV